MPSYRASNIEIFRQYDSDRYARIKSKAIALLSGKCDVCKETEPEFLTIDHVNNDGNVERSKLHHRQIWSRIVNGSVDSKRYRVLCRNCNSGLANKISFISDPVSSYPFIGDPCSTCGYPKLITTSKHSLYGVVRKRTDCRRCAKIRNRELRISALALFDSKCKCCGESDINKITFDHVQENGSLMRSSDHCGTRHFYKNLISEKLDSAAYQILCWNCNFSKHLGGGLCVHQRKE